MSKFLSPLEMIIAVLLQYAYNTYLVRKVTVENRWNTCPIEQRQRSGYPIDEHQITSTGKPDYTQTRQKQAKFHNIYFKREVRCYSKRW
jgi:hypothetical protein